MPLTDTAIRNAKPGDKPIKLFDGGGMFLLVTPNGQRYWRLKYRFSGKEKLLSLGVYPDVGLAAARKKRSDARALLDAGIDPSEAKKENKRATRLAAMNSFKAVALAWMEERWSNLASTRKHWPDSRRMCSRGLASAPFSTLTRQKSSPSSSVSTAEVHGLQRTEYAAKSVEYFVLALRRGFAKPIRRKTLLARSRPRRQHTSPRSPTRRRLRRCCARSMRSPAHSRFVARLSSPPYYLCALANCVRPNGRSSIWIGPNGATLSPKQKRSIWCRSPRRQSRFFANSTRLLDAAAIYFLVRGRRIDQ
ncbi:hypothetical protein X884_5616 [Burkholderia pseudomallei MSHR4308]|nr:hypothetical protein X884_5616 [Burkholderia pseudomallei MSHR4308]